MPELETPEIQQQTAESAPTSETEQAAASAAAESTETVESEQQTEQPRKGGVQKRIDELTRKAKLAEAEKEFWRQKALGEKKPEAAEKPSAEPKLEDFETTEAYLKAVRAYDREQLKAEFKAELANFGKQQQERSEAEQRETEWAEKEDAARKTHDDYEDVSAAAVESLKEAKGPGVAAIADHIQYSEVGPELLYHLGQHPEEIGTLTALHPRQAALALGRLEARLLTEKESGGAPKAVPHTRAPKPPTPIKGSKPADSGELNDSLSSEEWAKRFRKKLDS